MEAMTSGIDWITATLPVDAFMDQEWVDTALRCLDTVAADGHQLEYSGLNGYRGVRSGGCFVGSREDGHCVQFSGQYADRFFDRVYRYDAHISRLDVQTTVKFKTMPKRLAKEAYRDAITENETLPNARRRKIYVIVGSDGGDTCYIGAASSTARGRIYNKQVQSEDPAFMRCWRFEVTARNEVSDTLARTIYDKTTSRAQFCADWTAIWFSKRGVSVPWIYDETLVPVPPIKTLPTDVERKLNWLAHQVRPTVQYLLTVQERDAILAVLGLS